MPRPSKAVRRQKVNAATEFKKGNREEAYKIWAAADKARKELQAKKRKQPAAPAPAETALTEAEGGTEDAS